MMAEVERRFIRERQQAGIKAAKTRGIYRGRRPSIPVEPFHRISLDDASPRRSSASGPRPISLRDSSILLRFCDCLYECVVVSISGAQSWTTRRREAFAITLTDESAMAAAAISGESRMPKNG